MNSTEETIDPNDVWENGWDVWSAEGDGEWERIAWFKRKHHAIQYLQREFKAEPIPNEWERYEHRPPEWASNQTVTRFATTPPSQPPTK